MCMRYVSGMKVKNNQMKSYVIVDLEGQSREWSSTHDFGLPGLMS